MANKNKFTISFHETFSFSRASIAQILSKAVVDGKLDRGLLANTFLGSNYQKAMPRYAFRAGLFDEKKHLTPFGRFVTEHDPGLEKASTQWLLHYHLTAPHGPTAFWHYLVTQRFLPGNTFRATDLFEDLTMFLRREVGKSPASRSVRSAISVFIGTYLKSDGLNRLGILLEEKEGTYRVLAVDTPPIWVLGYALAEYWQANYGERLTVNLDELASENFAGIFLLGARRFTNLLVELKQEGFIDLYRIAHPYQIVLLQTDLEFALERLYA